MPILHAKIQVGGRLLPFVAGSFSFWQFTDYEGRPSTDVRLGLIKLTLVGEAATWGFWESWMLDAHRRQSGHPIFFQNEDQTAKTVIFYDAFCVHYTCRFDARGADGQGSFEVEINLSAAAKKVQGQFSEAHSVIPWDADKDTRYRALTKPADPLPSVSLLASPFRLTSEVGPTVEAAAEGTKATVGALVLKSANDPNAPRYNAEKNFSKDHPALPPDSDAFRLAQLETEREHRTLTVDEKTELTDLLAKVRGVHNLSDERVPHGFSSKAQFLQAGRELKTAIKESGIEYEAIGVRGSSVTGISSKGGEFRANSQGSMKPSDIDTFIDLSDDIGLTASKNIPGFIHPNKLMKRYPALSLWSEKWSSELGREITPGAFLPGAFTDSNTIKF